MKSIKIARLLALLLCAVMLAAVFAGCAKQDNTDNNADAGETQDASASAEPVTTASPDGSVTASPTEQAGTPDATGGAGSTEAAASSQPGTTEAVPGTTPEPGTTPVATQPAGSSAPITTLAPVDATPTAPLMTISPSLPVLTPTPKPTSGAATPAPTAAPTATPRPNNNYEAHYAGAVIEQIGLKAGDSFFWTLDLVNEHSRLWSGQWLVDYPETYFTCESYSVSWSGGITAQIQAGWDNDSAVSDIPAIVCNPDYMGNTGGHPLGQSGNMYANVGMYLTSFRYYGVQISGSLIRFKFTVKSMPADSALKHDSNGYYIEIPVLVCESTAFEDAPAGYPVQPYYGVPHGNVSVDPGKVYIRK